MTGFHEVRFPTALPKGATGGPDSQSRVVTGAGHEQHNVKWAEVRGRWNMGTGLKNSSSATGSAAYAGHSWRIAIAAYSGKAVTCLCDPISPWSTITRQIAETLPCA
jgi:hypothetical protein